METAFSNLGLMNLTTWKLDGLKLLFITKS